MLTRAVKWAIYRANQIMDSEGPVFEPEVPAPVKKRRGVTVVTPHGRALTFGVSKERTKSLLKAVAQRNEQEVTAAMQAQKAARMRKG